VHGGLRYLEQRRFGLVREALRERALLLTRLAPHIVEPVSFVYPLRHRGWERPYVGAGVLLYDVLGGAWSMPRHRHLSRGSVLALAPGLRADNTVGGIRYYDGRMDDARLAVAIARTAAEHGALVTTGTSVVGARADAAGGVRAVRVRDTDSDDVLDVRASAVAVCAGVWTPRVAELLGVPRPDALTVTASKACT
jgi:glycerol-3-phosphate dehydrogenase